MSPTLKLDATDPMEYVGISTRIQFYLFSFHDEAYDSSLELWIVIYVQNYELSCKLNYFNSIQKALSYILHIQVGNLSSHQRITWKSRIFEQHCNEELWIIWRWTFYFQIKALTFFYILWFFAEKHVNDKNE